jgi:uridine kinase
MYNLHSILKHKSPKVGGTIFVAIDGHGGSGKSTFAKLLSKHVQAEIIQTDAFASWKNPTDWHSSLIEKVFLPIQNGATHLSYDRSKWWDDHHPAPVKDQSVTNIMILEGVRSLRAELREYISLGILVDTPREVCLARGLERDLGTGKTRQELLKLWTEWLDSEDLYFENDVPYKYADIVVNGTVPFESQVKF